MTEELGLNRKLVRAIYPAVDWDEYDREVVAEALPDYEAALGALEWIATRADRRSDGTYNYDRDALRQKARDTLAPRRGEA